MITKPLTTLALSALIAGSVAYLSPAIADDANPAVVQPKKDNASPIDPSNTAANDSAQKQNDDTNNDSNEGISPDTATGEDDY